MTDLKQHFFSDRIVNKWNSLSEEIGIVSDSSVKKFKGKLQRLHNDGSSTGFLSLHDPPGRVSSLEKPNQVSYSGILNV